VALPTPLPKPTIPALLATVRASAAKSASINQAIRDASARLAAARQLNTGSGAGTGSGAAGPPTTEVVT
jgi:hypothetical protein